MVDGYVILDAKGADVNDITTGISIPGSHELLASAFSSGRSVIVVGLVSNDTPLAPTVAQVEKNEDDYILSGFSAKVTPDGRLVPVREGPYTLPVATSTTLGGIKVGVGLEIDENGVLKVQSTEPPEPPEPYVLPTASPTTLGGIKVGDSLSIDDGVLNTPVKLGFDAESGKYGYYKAGESVITPFEEGGGGEIFLEPIFQGPIYGYVSTGALYSYNGNTLTYLYVWDTQGITDYAITLKGSIIGARFRAGAYSSDITEVLPLEPQTTSKLIVSGESLAQIDSPSLSNAVARGHNTRRYVGLAVGISTDSTWGQVEAVLIPL